MENKYYYFDLKQREDGEVIETIENGVWRYGMTYLHIYKSPFWCLSMEGQFGAKGYVYEVEALATIFDSEDPQQYLTTALKIVRVHDEISWM